MSNWARETYPRLSSLPKGRALILLINLGIESHDDFLKWANGHGDQAFKKLCDVRGCGPRVAAGIFEWAGLPIRESKEDARRIWYSRKLDAVMCGKKAVLTGAFVRAEATKL